MKKVYEASSPGCYRVSRIVIDLFSSRTISAFSRLLTLLCFAVLGHTAAFAQGGCPGGACTITCPADVSLCLAPDNNGHSAITPDWVASFTSSPNPQCSITRVWKDAMGMEQMTEPIWVDCDDVDDHIDLWVSREKPLWVECRSSLVKVRVHIKDCEPPAIVCPPMGMYVCNDDVPRPGINYYGYKFLSGNQFAALGGSISDACGIWGVLYKDDVTVDPVCKTNRTIKRTFWAFDENNNSKSCTQDIIVADNEAPVFDENPADLELACDCNTGGGGGGGGNDDDDDHHDSPAPTDPCVAAIQAWLAINTNPGNTSGKQDAAAHDRCDENVVTITAFPATPAAILNEMPAPCDPNPREVIVIFTASDGCGNQATRSAKVRMVDNVEPTVPPIANSFYQCADQVPPLPNLGVVINARDNCTPSNKLVIAFDREERTDNGCPDRFTLKRYYTITDCAGNVKERNHTIVVNDDENPYWNPAPHALFLMDVCNPADLTTQIQGWMNDNGGGTPLDNCGTPTVMINKAATDVASELRRFCDSPGNNMRSTTVTFTARDACGNTRSATATVRLMDTRPPSGTPPPTARYDCADDVPQMLASQVIFLSDNCSDGNTVKVEIESNPTPEEGCEGYPFVIIRKWRLTDCAGNTSIVSQLIKVQDETAPQWTTFPDGIEVSCTNGSLNTILNDWLTNIGGGVALDQCSGSNLIYSADNFHNSVQKILDRLGPCAPYAGSTTVTFYAKDQCGNSVSRTVTVTVRDNTPPTATRVESMYSCPSQVPNPNPSVITDEADSCSPNPPSVVFIENATTNNGGKGCPGDPLIITRWYKLTDCSGNTSSQSHRITVVDMQAPNAVCKALTRSLGADGTVMVNANEFDNGSTDNCGIKKIEIRRAGTTTWFDKLTFNCNDIPNIPNCGANVDNSYIHNIEVRVTDNCDQSEICNTTITIKDEEPPTIQCPADMTFYTSNKPSYDCRANATWNHPVPHDNCSVLCMTMEVQKMINGQFVTVNPANDFPTPNLELNVLAQAGQPVTYMFGKGPYCTDNQYKIIYRVRDEHGNNKPGVMCMFTITIKDDEAPRWNDCPEDPIVAQTVTNDCYQMKCYKRPTAYDNCEYPGGPCPPPTVVVTVSDPTVMINQVGDEDCALFPVGRTVVSYTATDAEGNVSTCTVEVLISDPQPPVAMCAGPFTVNMEPDGVMQLSIADIDAPGTSDNCNICAKEIKRASSAYGPTVTLTCADVGTTVAITMRVKDCSQPVANEATCVAMVTVQDMQSPGVAFCPQDITVGTASNACNAVATYSQPLFNDGCGSPHTGTLTQGLPSGSVFPKGITHIQYCYTSASGYTVCCDFNVTVEDDDNPTITCPANVTNLTCLQVLPAPLTLGGFTGGTLTDNCGVTALEFSDYDNDLTHCPYDGIRTIIRTYRAFDAAGNSASCTQTFQYVEDVTPPVLSYKPADITLQCADDIPAVGAQSATDNCGDVVIDFSEEVQPNGCENKLVVIRYWVASDACGNTATWRQTITVDDTTPPELYAKPLRRHYACAEEVEIAPYQFATDNCDVAYVEFSETTNPGDCHNSFVIERRWVAYDLCGNSSTWEQIIDVLDTIPPVLSATPVDRTYSCYEDVEAAPVQVATDNCGVVTLNFEETEDPGICYNQRVITRRWYAYDLCGNTAEHWQTITVFDDEPPVLLATPTDRTYECADQIPVAPVQTATDNCDVVTIDFAETTIPGNCPNQYQVVRRWYAYDLCGNTDEHWQTITISDTKAPVFDQPLPDAVVNVDCAQDVPVAAVLTATDNCDDPVNVAYSEELRPGDCQDRFSIRRTWTAEDLCGNITRYTQTVNVYDSEAPVWDQPAPDNPLVECSEDVPALPIQTATDNCGVAVTLDIVETTVPGTCPNQYVVIRQWTAQDACGNATTRVQVVTVSDIEAPTWNEAAPETPLAFDCSEDVPPVPVQTASDNCDVPVDVEYYETTAPGSCPNSFVLTRVWTAEDDCGNSTIRTQVITISDTEAPVWDQAAPASPVNVSCSENVPPVPVQTATDNCSVPVDINFNEVINWGTCGNQFQVVRTWTAADDCGNITTRVQIINVNDVTPPVLAGLPAATVNVECSEQVPAVANVTASDNCVRPVFLDFSEVEIPGTCPNQYQIKRTWFAQDDCGNSTVFTQTITISDTKAPVFSGLPAATVNVECSEQVPALANVTATDNCAAPVDVEISEIEIPGTCPNQYVITRTWTAEDDCGNSTVFTQTITISDTKAPVFAGLPAATVNVECSEQVPALANVTATDNCAAPVDVEISEIEIPGTCPNQYQIKRTWTAEDDCGNSTVFTQTITISDTKAPVWTSPLPADLTVQCGENVPAAATLTASDNCAAPVDIELSETFLPGSGPNDLAKLVRTWTAEDDCGNATTHVQMITILDTQAPVLGNLPAATVNVSCSENVPAVANVTVTDNCQGTVDLDFNEVIAPGTCPNQYSVIRTWTAVDFAGNSTVFVQTITVNDTEAPVMSGLPAAALVNVSCAQDVPAVPVVTATDNCIVPIVVQFSEVEIPGTCANQYSITRTWSAQDDCGNATFFVQTIVINDTQAPTWNQPAPVTPINVKGAGDVPPVPTQTATDNCGVPVIVDFSETVQQGNCLHQFTVTRTWVAQDDCGNSTVRQQVINVNDDVPPVLTCPPAQTAQCSPAEIPPYANLTEFIAAGGTATDNNGLNVNSFGLVSEVKNGNVYTRTYRVIDQCGNSATCQQTITVMDTQPPVFLNCPTGPLVFGNDPDMCWAKINWPKPVAVDNCSIPTVIQTSGPTSGDTVTVGTYTVVFTATDASNNVSTCSFTVMVMDTQNPEFDADIVMPADVTVQCDAVPAPFVLTTNDVHDNCTPSNLLVITFTEVRTNGNCPFNYILTRTWKVTDQAGKMLIHTQKVTVVDTKAPTAKCKNITVTLDKAGNATITGADVNNGSTDNCSAPANLTYSVTPNTFNCSKLGPNVVTLTVTDECGNSATCTATVTVQEGIGPCTPQFTVTTTCLNNATTLDNGQFQDLITVKSLAMQTWTLMTNTGLYSINSPAPPAAPVALPAGTAFTAGTADGIDNDGDGQIDEADEMVYYTLRGRHIEGVGYTIMVKNNLNQTGTISNKGYYPSPYFINLNDPFCLNTPPFTIQVGEYNNAQGNVINVMVNGVPTTTFDAAALGIGFHTVMATFDAGTATTNLVINGQLVGGTDAQAQADPGCQQKITKIVQVTNTPPVVVCNDLVNVSIHNDGGDCVFVVAPDDVLEGSYLCDDDYSVVITYPFGTHTFTPPNRVDYTHIGKLLNYSLVHAISGNVCWGKIKVEDKEPPVLTCPGNITIACSDPTETFFTGNVIVSDCHPTVNTIVTDDFTDFGSCNNPRAQIIRTWLSTDGSGNQASCTQVITIKPFNLADVNFPADVTLNCASANSTDPAATGVPTINGSPIGTGGLCMASISRTDDRYDICPGSYEIVRTWKVRNMCLPLGQGNPVEHAQVIKVVDTNGPAFACPANVTVSVDPFSCCATAALPDVIITEGCSYVTSLTYKVVGTDFATGNLVIYEGSGYLSDFPGNNWWNPDTMGVFGFTQCLPRGEYTVTYTATDGCDNVSKCTFTMFVEDQIPPVSACDEFTQVALGADGMAFVNASTFDDGSYDVCENVHFKARRMNDNDCQDNDFFYDQVKFCCSDINDTVLVVFRVYDIPVPNGPVALDLGEGHWNDCMVQVFVEDKIKPLCNAPANTTVSCENFDPSLWAYGAATAVDNCCMDTITTTVSYSLFDTVCNRGTITRTFRAIDCGGNQAVCSQRILVNYEQDYYVKFPNDVIITVCDGTGNYGEPTFFGEDCELLGVSYEDEVFTVVPDACFKIERTWTIINWCTYNPNAGCINVPNPNPNATVNNPANLTGPTVSPAGTPAPWNPTVIAIQPGQTPTNYSIFWDANANCYKYKQIIKIIDTQDPIVEDCPASPVEVCDLTPNNNQLWNESYWYDSNINTHDLCEAPTDLTITATDLCSGASVNVRYLLFLDLDGDGNMETVISSTNLPGFNTVNFGNAGNANFGGGTPRQFDERPVPSNQKYGFALQTTVNGTKKTASVRWNTQQNPGAYTVPELPYGTHKIKWIVEDGCGNETVCEYTFIVKDCKAPTVVCLNGLSVNIMPTKMIQMWASDFLQYTEDNCTPSNQIVLGIRRSGTGTGFPLNPDGTPQTSVTFTCDDLGTQLVELWGIDKAGNADYCETYVIVQDNNNNCNGPGAGTVAGLLATETNNGLEEANVELDGSHPALPPSTMFDLSDNTGHYEFSAVPFLGDYTVTPMKDNDPLNGVSTFDLVLINKHILGLEPLNSPYKMIGADANNSRSITTFDIVELRKLILGIYTELPNNTSWRFIDADYQFPNPANPFQEIFPETKQIADMQTNMTGQDFVSQKVGDVNGNAVTSSLTTTEDRTAGTLLFDVQDRQVKAGESFTVNFRAAERVMGYQFTMYFPNLEVTDVKAGADMKLDNFGIFNSDHALTTSFDNEHVIGEFSVTFRAKAAGMLSEMLSVSSRITKAEAYDLNREPQAIALRFNGQNGSTITGLGFELYQNQPNPWMNKTQVGFYLPEAAEATLTIFDETGRTLFTQKGDFGKGYNAIAIERALVNTTGVLYYKVETATDSAVKKMIQTK